MNAVRFTIAAAVALVLVLAGAGTSLAVIPSDASIHSALKADNGNSGGVYIFTADETTRAGGDAFQTSGDGYILDFHYAVDGSDGDREQ